MQPVIDFVVANPLYGVGIAVLLLFLVVSLVKQAFKLALIALVVSGVYSYFLHDLANDAYARAATAAEAVAGQARELLDDARENAR